MVKNSGIISVLDVGARYGLHPSWKNLDTPAEFVLVDADPAECARLRKRYQGHPNVIVVEKALGDTDGTATLMVRSNPAMTGILRRNAISPLYSGSRFGQEDVVKTLTVGQQTMDSFVQLHGYSFDFVKLDTEGNAGLILSGWSDLQDLLAVRAEVSFDQVFEGLEKPSKDGHGLGGTFCHVHGRMAEEGFVLLNFDYLGQGDFFSSMVRSNERYGVLQTTDAVWIRDPHAIIAQSDNMDVLLKAALFSFRNSAPDLALWLLENTTIPGKMRHCQEGLESLYYSVRNLVIQHLYSLKWCPGQDIGSHEEWFEKLWGSPLPRMSQYNESIEHNPIDIIDTH